MDWGPVDWVGKVLPGPKFENKCTSLFEFFGFERPLLRYGGSVFSVTERRGRGRGRTEWRILGSGYDSRSDKTRRGDVIVGGFLF